VKMNKSISPIIQLIREPKFVTSVLRKYPVIRFLAFLLIILNYIYFYQLTFGTGEVLIQVCHFNGNVQSYYGTPILVKIRNAESIKAVRSRIREVLDVPEKVIFKQKKIKKKI